MTSARLAVIDLGTNTFHLLIVEASGTPWKELYRERIFVNLAEEGIHRISDSARERGLDALKYFAGIIKDHDISDTVAVGTAALRRAHNSDEFVRDVQQELGIAIRVIGGQKEAEYIHAGVMQAIPPAPENYLIMDIGGGSVEFIISSNRQPMYSVSYPIGVAVLYDKFHKTEPIATNETEDIDHFLTRTMEELSANMTPLGSLGLIGASGTFELIDVTLQNRLTRYPFSSIKQNDFFAMYHRVMPMTYEERKLDNNIPLSRARYIVVALKLIQHVLSVYRISSIGVSRYALKEGIVSEWRNNLD
jgi:exopolyphosphatase / guanosine-5'-triphosphate,3'-diphosphate pyrophosphatase